MHREIFKKKVRKNLVDFINSLPNRISKNANYFIEGKRLRSNLMYEVGEILDCPFDKIVLPASVLELIHTTTIIHDDVLDKTQIRRGEKTIHSIYKKRISVFSADYLIATSLEKLAKNSNIELQRLFYRKIKEVCLGEIKQDFNNNFKHPLSIDECVDIAAKKTGALFGVSFAVPAIVANLKNDNQLSNQTGVIEEIGDLYGTIYQLLDDYSDMTFDARTEKGKNESTFRHWTITSVLWNQIDPEHLDRFVSSKNITLEDTLKDKIFKRLFEVIHSLIMDFKKKLDQINNPAVNTCFKLMIKEVNRFSPRPIEIL